ncbi:DUF4157 domain-containing protein [Roseomonas populi]|uniref:DUF4157 domain-containing protein n=1 Tax=Roseomonas populi TaxID=3121582 RepID=UPI0027E22E62|nr:DUF4157 domain-containing protein [Roseomonas pecuniae]
MKVARPAAAPPQRAASTVPARPAPEIGGALRGLLTRPGAPLPPAAREDASRRLGHDFAAVRVHADGPAAALAARLGARAFAVGHHVGFAAGRYAPGTPDGARLLRHELVHVLQQRGAANSPEPARASLAQEAEARRLAEGTGSATGPVAVQRGPAVLALEAPEGRITGLRLLLGGQPALVIETTGGPRRFAVARTTLPIGTYHVTLRFMPLPGGAGRPKWFLGLAPAGPEDRARMTGRDLQVSVDTTQLDGDALARSGPVTVPLVVAPGGGAGAQRRPPPSATRDASSGGAVVVADPYPATLIGPRLQATGGKSIYTMNLQYGAALSFASPRLQVFEAANAVSYAWSVQGAGGAARAVTRTEGALEQFGRDARARAEDTAAARADAERHEAEGRHGAAMASEAAARLEGATAIVETVGATINLVGSATSPRDWEREVVWPTRPGRYTLRVVATPADRPQSDGTVLRRRPSVAEAEVEVRPPQEIAREGEAAMAQQRDALRKQMEEAADPDELARLKRRVDEADAFETRPPEEYLALRLANLEAELEEARREGDPFRQRALREEVETLKRQSSLAAARRADLGGTVLQPRALVASEVTGQTYPLLLQMVAEPRPGGGWRARISDVTSPAGRGDAVGEGASAAEAAFAAAKQLAASNDYGRGWLQFRLPGAAPFAGESQTFRNANRGDALARSRLRDLATVVGTVAIVVPGLGAVGGVLGAAVAADRLIDRYRDGRLDWKNPDPEALGDVLALLSAAASGLSGAAGQLGRLRVVREGSRVVVLAQRGTALAERALDEVQLFIAGADLLDQIAAINKAEASGSISGLEANRQRVAAMGAAAQTVAPALGKVVHGVRQQRVASEAPGRPGAKRPRAAEPPAEGMAEPPGGAAHPAAAQPHAPATAEATATPHQSSGGAAAPSPRPARAPPDTLPDGTIVIRHFSPEDYLHNITSARDAVRTRERMIREQPHMELDLWRDRKSGKRVITQGDTTWNSYAMLRTDPDLAGGEWVLERHYHPPADAADIWRRLPSVADYRALRRAHERQGSMKPVHSVLDWTDPVTGQRHRTRFAYDPDPTVNEPYSLTYRALDGTLQTRRWSEMQQYEGFQKRFTGTAADVVAPAEPPSTRREGRGRPPTTAVNSSGPHEAAADPALEESTRVARKPAPRDDDPAQPGRPPRPVPVPLPTGPRKAPSMAAPAPPSPARSTPQGGAGARRPGADPGGPGTVLRDFSVNNMRREDAAYQLHAAGLRMGQGYYVPRPGTDVPVQFDGFRDGYLIDAKYYLANGFFVKGANAYIANPHSGFAERWYNERYTSIMAEAQRQMQAAGNTPILWRVASPEATQLLRQIFSAQGVRIRVEHYPPK